MTLLQIHWQWTKNGATVKTEMVAQNEINSSQEMQEWANEVRQDHPLPNGAIWMVCNDQSKHFVWAAIERQKEGE